MNCARLAPRSSTESRTTLQLAWAATAGLVFWTLGVCLLPVMAWAQAPQTELGAGARVRVRSAALSEPVLMGRVLALSGDTLSFAAEGHQDIPMRVLLDDRTRVDLSIEHHNRLGRGLLIGGLVGGTIGGVIVGMSQLNNGLGEGIGDIAAGLTGAPPPPHEEVSNAPAIMGLVAGCALGGLIGASLTVDRWVPTKLPTRVSFGASSAAAATVRFTVSLSRSLALTRN